MKSDAALATIGLLFLGACTLPWASPWEGTRPASPGQAAPDKPAAAAAAVGPKPAAIARPAPGLEPQALVGLDPEQAEFILGRPSDVRQEPPATVWTYRSGSCTLDLFFYADIQSRALKSLAFDLKAPATTESARRDCFATIVADHRERR
ncbi:MAG: hypothetical protein HY521_01145 [Proteobacteria bacterium]|nr:hypothetical protein [Pseudomonadota bacterium]